VKKRIRDIKRIVKQALKLNDCPKVKFHLLEIGAIAERIEDDLPI